MFFGSKRYTIPALFSRLPRGKQNRIVLTGKLHGREAAVELLRFFNAVGYVK